MGKTPDAIGKLALSPNCSLVNFVNKSVDMNSLSAKRNLLECSQFIERTELDGGGQQIDVGLLQDKPRRLGKS